jgi:hypothetical protein
MDTKKRFFLNHKKSSALMVSIVVHAVFISVALTFVAVNVYIKPEQVFKSTEVKRPQMRLRKLQVPVDQKKMQAPKLRHNIVSPKIKDTAITMPEVIGVPGGGYGNGSGLGGLGFGFDMNLNFFGLKAKADGQSHIVFIIDYSGSMTGEKDRIMRREVSRVLEELPEETQFGVIFFSGPAWPAGKGQSINSSDWVKGDGYHTYRPKDWDDLPSVEYEPATSGRIAKMIRVVESTPLSGGTVYDCPIYMALKMKPIPDTIFFMTDGACAESRGIVSLRKMVDQLKAAGEKVPVLHTVGFGIARNRQLEAMAKLMGGESNFLTAEEYIKEHGPNEKEYKKSDMNQVIPGSGKENRIVQVDDEKYPVEFKLR